MNLNRKYSPVSLQGGLITEGGLVKHGALYIKQSTWNNQHGHKHWEHVVKKEKHIWKNKINITNTVFAVISAHGTYKIIQTGQIQTPHN